MNANITQTLQSFCTTGIGRSRRYHKRGQISFSYNGKSMQIFRGSIASGDLLRIEGHDCIFKRKKANHYLYFLFSFIKFIEKKMNGCIRIVLKAGRVTQPQNKSVLHNLLTIKCPHLSLNGIFILSQGQWGNERLQELR